MLHKTILLFFLIVNFSCFAQKTVKIYLDSTWKKLPDSLNASYYRIIEFDSTCEAKNVVKDYRISRQLQMISASKDPLSDSIKLHGRTIYYHKNGTIEQKAYFLKGIITGPDSVWREDGTLFMTKFYKEGKIIGDFKVFHKDGKNLKRIDRYSEGNFVSGNCFDEASNEVEFYPFEVIPEFKGGIMAMMKFIRKNIFYPKDAYKAKIQGRVIVQVTIDKEGKIIYTSILKGVNHSLDNEALRVIRNMPNWSPGKIDGVPVKFKMAIPIKYQL